MRQWFHNPGVTTQPRPGRTLRTPSSVPSPRVSYLLLPVHATPATPRRRGPAGVGAGKVTYSGHNHLTKPVASSQAPGERWRLAAALRTGRDQSLGSRGPGGSWGRGVVLWAGRSSAQYTVISPAPVTISVANFVSKHCNVACSQVVRLLSSNTFGNENMSTFIYYVSSGPGGMIAIKGCLIDM